MKLLLLIPLRILLEQFFLLTSSGEGVILYVKPFQHTSPSTTSCPGQPCETLQYYLNNVNATINQQKNVTMIFMNGNHTVSDTKVSITAPVIKMTGDISSENPVVYCTKTSTCDLPCCVLEFYDTITVCIENLVITSSWDMINFWKRPVSSGLSQLATNVQLLSVKLCHCFISLNMTQTYIQEVIFFDVFVHSVFSNATINSCIFYSSSILLYHAVKVAMKDCRMLNTYIFLEWSNITFSGITTLVENDYYSAILSYLSNITLSGKVSFLNNTSVTGGAVALYSSTLNIAAGANVTFINNSAQDKGGTLYIEQGITPNMVISYLITPPCFYHLLNCDEKATYNIFFANNSATNGGDDIYGAFLQISSCASSKSNKCKLNVNGSSSKLSSVSSDALRVCICDINGNPQCNDTDYIYMSREVHPGEKFTVSAVI